MNHDTTSFETSGSFLCKEYPCLYVNSSGEPCNTKPFANKYELNRHGKIHTGIKLVCQYCVAQHKSQALSQPSSMDHKATSVKNKVSNIFRTVQNSNLKDHIRRRHPEVPLPEPRKRKAVIRSKVNEYNSIQAINHASASKPVYLYHNIVDHQHSSSLNLRHALPTPYDSGQVSQSKRRKRNSWSGGSSFAPQNGNLSVFDGSHDVKPFLTPKGATTTLHHGSLTEPTDVLMLKYQYDQYHGNALQMGGHILDVASDMTALRSEEAPSPSSTNDSLSPPVLFNQSSLWTSCQHSSPVSFPAEVTPDMQYALHAQQSLSDYDLHHNHHQLLSTPESYSNALGLVSKAEGLSLNENVDNSLYTESANHWAYNSYALERESKTVNYNASS